MLELTKFNGFFKSDFDVFRERNEYGIYSVNNKLKNTVKLLYNKHTDLKDILPYWKMGRVNMYRVSTFMSKSEKKHYSVPHFYIHLGLDDFYIHTCFEAKHISRKFVRTLRKDLNKRIKFTGILKKAEGFMIEINKLDFMRVRSKENKYTTLAHIWLDKDWFMEDIVKFIYTQMDKINNLQSEQFTTKKACFYLRKYISRFNPIIKKPEFVDEVYNTIQELLPMYDFLLEIA